MRQIRRTGLVAAMVTGGALAAAGAAHADSGAQGSAAGSQGLLSGNTVQIPVHVPVNVCGNTVNVVGLLNPAVGNSCENEGNGTGGGTGSGGAVAETSTEDSPGVLSGNAVQLPVDVPVNVTGNSVNVVGVGNASVGNSSSNTSNPPARPRPVTPPKTVTPSEVLPASRGLEPQQGPVRLAETGTPSSLGLTLPAGAALVLGGALLYRRARAAA
ncbi:chaplin [Streptomyces wuyuanensis]|uniref:Small secreted domain n=1 Tax=Streptomyces wuyuanensis TaxID=1196353 RepID=A0A1G9QNC7_9ACTN|nr:chaplin [Streptomyces wuyuanensis]SDM12532.1 Small secreted domain [Streptomyces wuyuanensis]